MTGPHDQLPGPPRGAMAVLRYALPCGPMRDAILGDLHEEFVRDAAAMGPRRARWHYRRRTAEITAHAAWDSLCWRSWVSTDAESEPAHASALPRAADVTQTLSGIFTRVRGHGGDLGRAALALGVIVVGIVVNTLLFSAAAGGASRSVAHEGSLLFSALGLGSLVFVLACAGVATALICVGPRRRRRKRHQDTISIK